MNGTARLVLAAAVVLALAAGRVNADEPKASADVVKVAVASDKPDDDGKQTVTITLTLKKPWRILANPVGNKDLVKGQTEVAVSGGKPEVKIDYPAGTLTKIKDVGEYRVYEDRAEIKAHVRRAKGDTEKLEVSVTFMAEDPDKGVCLLPSTVKVAVPAPSKP